MLETSKHIDQEDGVDHVPVTAHFAQGIGQKYGKSQLGVNQ